MIKPSAHHLNAEQLARLGVGDVQSNGRLSVRMRVVVTDGHWQGRTGTIVRIQRDASAAGEVFNVLVDLDGACQVPFDPAFLNELP